MHISDGGLSTAVCAVGYAASAVGIAFAVKGTKEEDIPKISLMAGTFFAISLIMIPIPPSSVHPLMCGLIGIIVGRRAPLAFFPALLLQALLFQHGGITTLGANTLMLSISSILSTVSMPLSSYLATACLLCIRGPSAYIDTLSFLSSSFQAIFIALLTPKQKPALSAINIFFNLHHQPFILI